MTIKNHSCSHSIVNENVAHVRLTYLCIRRWAWPYNTVEKVTPIDDISQHTQVGAETTEVMLVQLLRVFSMKCHQREMVAGVQAYTSSILLDP